MLDLSHDMLVFGRKMWNRMDVSHNSKKNVTQFTSKCHMFSYDITIFAIPVWESATHCYCKLAITCKIQIEGRDWGRFFSIIRGDVTRNVFFSYCCCSILQWLNIQYFSKPGDTFCLGAASSGLAWPHLTLTCHVLSCLALSCMGLKITLFHQI